MSSLGQSAKAAVIWSAGLGLFRDMLQFAVMLVLVRLLQPEAYGEFGLVTSIMGFITMFSVRSFVGYTLQVRDDKGAHFQDHFTAGAVVQSTLVAATIVVALVLRFFPKYAQVSPYLLVMSVLYLLDWPCELRRRMIERKFDWKRLRGLHAIGLLATAVLAVVMALSGMGTYALLLPGLAVTFPFIYDLFVREGWRPTWQWSWQAYKPAWDFGITRAASGLAITGRQLIESGVLAGALGFGVLGFLNRAMGLSQLFCRKFAEQLVDAIYPVLTRVNPDPLSISRINALVLRTVAWVVVPLGTIFAKLSGPIVNTLYGSKWLSVAPLLPWAMLAGVAIALGYTVNTLLLAQNRQRRCLAADLMTLVGTLLVLLVALPYGAKAYLIGTAMVQVLVFGVMIVWLVQTGALKLRAALAALTSPALAALGAVLLCDGLWRGFQLERSEFIGAAGYGMTFWFLYFATLRVIFASQLIELMPYVPGRRYFSRVLVLQQS